MVSREYERHIRVSNRKTLEQLKIAEYSYCQWSTQVDAGKNAGAQLRMLRHEQETNARIRNLEVKRQDFRRRIAKTRPLSA